MFWQVAPLSFLWNRIAISLAGQRRLTLAQTARVLALVNVAYADAAIACWDAKYHHSFWRPVTAIRQGVEDNNPETTADSTWEPLLATPPHPEYPSAHSTASGGAAAVLANLFGEDTSFAAESDLMLGIQRHFSSFTEALDEIRAARILVGIHFRSACIDGQTMGVAVGRFVMRNAMRPLSGDREEQYAEREDLAAGIEVSR